MFLALLSPATLLDGLLNDPVLRGAEVSAYVCLADGRKLYGRNEGTRMVPASNQKLFSAAFALDALGFDYKPKTRFWVQEDRLVIDSPGDPGMTYEQLLDIKAKLRLDGRLPVELHEAYRPGYPPTWEWDDLPNRYGAPITAFSANRGGVEVFAEGARITVEPYPFGIITMRMGSSGPRRVDYDPLSRIAKVYGEMPAKRTRLDALSVRDPDRQAALVLGSRVSETNTVPAGSPTFVWEGASLKNLMRECLVKSDNTLAENLLLMGVSKGQDLGDDPYPRARQELSAFLVSKVGVQVGDVRPYDGSGLSRHDMTTTRALARVLAWEASLPTGQQWKDCLDRPGCGTMVGRLDKSSFIGKTGTMEGIVALGGYVRMADGKEAVLSLVFNEALAESKDLRRIEDSFVRALEGMKSSDLEPGKSLLAG